LMGEKKRVNYNTEKIHSNEGKDFDKTGVQLKERKKDACKEGKQTSSKKESFPNFSERKSFFCRGQVGKIKKGGEGSEV